MASNKEANMERYFGKEKEAKVKCSVLPKYLSAVLWGCLNERAKQCIKSTSAAVLCL